ncbi:MAG TPA: type II secretion system protein [Pyrinomonadaceae bacterium]
MTGKTLKIQDFFKGQRLKIEDKSEIRNPKSKIESGFSLLELMITMFILIILISVVMPTYQRSVQHARETVLRENIWQMRRSIDQYAADKGKLPASIDDLVEGKYLREKPVDPITEKAEWKEIQGEDPNSPDAEQGLTDVKSLADGEDSEGKKFEDY